MPDPTRPSRTLAENLSTGEKPDYAALRTCLLLSLNEGVGARLITRDQALDVIEVWDSATSQGEPS